MADEKKLPSADNLRRDGAFCLTFVNTAGRQPLNEYADLLAWGRWSGALSARAAGRLRRDENQRDDDDIVVADLLAVRRVERVRALLQRLFVAVASGQTPLGDDLAVFNEHLAEALARRRLTVKQDEWNWTWHVTEKDDLEPLLWQVLVSASEILTSKDRHLVRQCAGEDCDLLFVDRAPGSRRKWCHPITCGHRNRSHKHYHKTVKPAHQRSMARIRAEKARREMESLLAFKAQLAKSDGSD